MIVREKEFVCQRCGAHFRLRARYAYYCRPCHAQVHGVAANLGEVPLVQKKNVPIVAEAAYGPDFGHMAEME